MRIILHLLFSSFIFVNIAFSQIIDFRSIDIKNIISAPTSFAIDHEKKLYLLDTENNKLVKIDLNGVLLKEIGSFGSEEYSFDSPMSICASVGLNIYVTDCYNHRIIRYNKNLEYINNLNLKDNSYTYKQFGFPTLITTDRLSNLFIYDNENKQILKINNKNQVERTFGGYYEPKEIRVDAPLKFITSARDELLILEKNKLLIFDNLGSFIRVLYFPKDFNAISFSLDNNYFYIVLEEKLVVTETNGVQRLKIKLKENFNYLEEETTKDIVVKGEDIFLLTSNRVLIIKKKNILSYE